LHFVHVLALLLKVLPEFASFSEACKTRDIEASKNDGVWDQKPLLLLLPQGHDACSKTVVAKVVDSEMSIWSIDALEIYYRNQEKRRPNLSSARDQLEARSRSSRFLPSRPEPRPIVSRENKKQEMPRRDDRSKNTELLMSC
jgi:hypothetical protein